MSGIVCIVLSSYNNLPAVDGHNPAIVFNSNLTKCIVHLLIVH